MSLLSMLNEILGEDGLSYGYGIVYLDCKDNLFYCAEIFCSSL